MRRSIAAAAVAGGLAVVSQGAAASGFAIMEQGVSGLGTAFAGGAAEAQDAATVFFNPAGMTRLEGTLAVAGNHVVVPSAKFRDGGSRTVLGTSLGSHTGGDAGSVEAVPNAYLVTDLGGGYKFGLAVNAPFALSTHYDRDWIGRYHAVDSEVLAINVSPSLAWRLNQRVALGVGIDIQHMEATLSNAIDYGTLDALAAGGAFGLTPGASDGYAEMTGNDLAWGWNVGALVDLTKRTRLGLHYRSSIDYHLRGNVDFSTPAAALPLAAALGQVDGEASADLTTPDVLSLSLFHQLDERWAIMADLSRTGWDNLDELRIRFDSGAADSVTTLHWNDVWRYSVGVSYTPNPRWIWRAGLAYDETPIPNAEKRTPRIPGNDRRWVALGFGYRVSDHFSFDVGYAHLWVDDPQIDKLTALPTLDENTFRGSLVGSYAASVEILSAQLNWRF
ncbi:OmpP1/FadL family transporter [Endothiovibrio diazotrophicus]